MSSPSVEEVREEARDVLAEWLDGRYDEESRRYSNVSYAEHAEEGDVYSVASAGRRYGSTRFRFRIRITVEEETP